MQDLLPEAARCKGTRVIGTCKVESDHGIWQHVLAIRVDQLFPDS